MPCYQNQKYSRKLLDPFKLVKKWPGSGALPQQHSYSCLWIWPISRAFPIPSRLLLPTFILGRLEDRTTGKEKQKPVSHSCISPCSKFKNEKGKKKHYVFFLIQVATEAKPFNLQAIKLIYWSCHSIPDQTFEGNFKGEADLIR